MRVVAIEPSGLLYGSEFCLLDVVSGLTGDRFAWTVVTPGGGGFDALLAARGIRSELNILPRMLHQSGRATKLSAYVRLFRFLSTVRPDVVYLNQAGLLRSVAVMCGLLSLPIICQVQTLEDAKLVSGRRRDFGGVMSFICNSQFIADAAAVDIRRRSILFQGIEPPDNSQLTPKVVQSPDCLTIGILGRIARSKGHYLLVEAAAQLRAARFPFRVRVIGAGLTPRDETELRSAVDRAELADAFEFRGYRTDLAAELNPLDLLVIPSLAEPLGRVLFDAAKYRVPVVASDAGGLGELCKRFSIGRTFRSEDANSLAAAIKCAAENLADEHRRFYSAAKGMFRRLSMTSYLSEMTLVLKSAARFEPVGRVWLGDQDT